MYFEAEMMGHKYQLDITEEPRFWRIKLRKDGEEDAELHCIRKSDYLELDGAVSFLFNGSSYMVDVDGQGVDFTVYTRGSFREIPIYNDESLLHESLKGGGGMGGGNALTAGMPGKIVKVIAQAGDKLQQGQPILIMEAMKMENEMRASHDLKIKEVLVTDGDSVEAGATLVTFE